MASHSRHVVGLVAALAVTFMLAPAAMARADQGWFQFVDPISDPTSLPECLAPDVADIVGSQQATETFTGHITENGTGVHVTGTGTLDYRVDFPDGRYGVGLATWHFAFGVSANGQTTTTEVIREPRTIHAADGQVLVRVVIHALSKTTYRDGNANGEPDPGELSVAFERFFFTCR
jgi:hypothetical protein